MSNNLDVVVKTYVDQSPTAPNDSSIALMKAVQRRTNNNGKRGKLFGVNGNLGTEGNRFQIAKDFDAESTTFSSPELDILSWIPKEYQPDKYKETLSAQIESVKDNDCEATILRNRISKLLLEVGHLEFNRHKKFKSPNTSLNLAFDNIISIMQKIHSVHNNSKLQNDKKRMIIKQLKQRSNEALIFLGRTSIKLHNRNNHKCNNIKRYQRELRILVDRLSKLS